LVGRYGPCGPVRPKLIESPVKPDHLTIEIIESTKAEVAVFSKLPVCGLTFVNPGDQSGHQGGLKQLSCPMVFAA
jgi:hypothetical protein